MGTSNTDSKIFFHGVNNYFENVGGHAFDIDTNTWVLLEGNYFDNVTTPITETSLNSGALIYNVPTVDAASACKDPLDISANGISWQTRVIGRQGRMKKFLFRRRAIRALWWIMSRLVMFLRMLLLTQVWESCNLTQKT